MGTERLAQWLIAECARRGESYREASRKAGVANNTISEIINTGAQPGVKRLVALAQTDVDAAHRDASPVTNWLL